MAVLGLALALGMLCKCQGHQILAHSMGLASESEYEESAILPRAVYGWPLVVQCNKRFYNVLRLCFKYNLCVAYVDCITYYMFEIESIF